MQEAKSAVKGSRKALPASFVEVIDTLVDTIFAHRGSPFSAPDSSALPLLPLCWAMMGRQPWEVLGLRGARSFGAGPAQDSKPQGEASPQQQPTAAGNQTPPSATAPALMSPVGAERSTEPAEASAPGATDPQPLVSSHTRGASTFPNCECKPLAVVRLGTGEGCRLLVCAQLYSKKEHSVLIQCIALKMLTDFTLMYNSTVGVILRRDAELVAGKGCSPRKTPRKEAHKHTGVLLR